MISFYVSSRSLTEKNKDIKVKVTLPMKENKIIVVYQKAELVDFDDCMISEIHCDVTQAEEFLKRINTNDVFEINTFAMMLLKMTDKEVLKYSNYLVEKKPEGIKEAVYDYQP